MKFSVRKLLPVAIGLAVVGMIVYAFLPTPVPVDLGRVTRGLLRVTVDEDGKTRVKERYVVSAPLAGRLQRIVLKAGDPVEAGNGTIATIEPKDPELLDPSARAQAEARVKAAQAVTKQAAANLERTRAGYDLARADLARARQLIGSRSISAQDFETAEQRERSAAAELRSAQFAVQIAAFELEQAQAVLLRTQPRSPGEVEPGAFVIRSPINGRVLRVFQESATVVTPGTRLLELGDTNDLEVEVDVLSSDAVKIRPGAKVLMEHWGGGEPLLGRVRLVEPAAFTKVSALGVEEQRVWVIVDFIEPAVKRQALGDAYRVEARFVIWEGENALKVPAGALFRQGDGWAVFVVDNGRTVLRPVRVGQSNGLETEVLEGLDENDTVIVHPSDKVRPGVTVVSR
jgi:HlyD family secretion protein